MAQHSPIDQLNWLNQNPRLEELMEHYPKIWEDACQELVSAVQSGRVQKLNEFATKAKLNAEIWKNRIQKTSASPSSPRTCGEPQGYLSPANEKPTIVAEEAIAT